MLVASVPTLMTIFRRFEISNTLSPIRMRQTTDGRRYWLMEIWFLRGVLVVRIFPLVVGESLARSEANLIH